MTRTQRIVLAGAGILASGLACGVSVWLASNLSAYYGFAVGISGGLLGVSLGQFTEALASPAQPDSSIMRMTIGANLVFTEEAKLPKPEGEPETLIGVTGWRYMRLERSLVDRSFYLRGTYSGTMSERESLPARCSQGAEHPAPAWECQCGYYAYSLGPAAPFIVDRNETVAVKVSAAGETILADQGFRTYRYRIDALYISPELDMIIEELHVQFGVPVHTWEDLTDADRYGTAHRHRGAATGDSEAAREAGVASEGA